MLYEQTNISLLDIAPETCCFFYFTSPHLPTYCFTVPPNPLGCLGVNLGRQHVPNLLQHRQELRLQVRVTGCLHRGNHVAQVGLHDRVKADNVFFNVGVLQA